MKTLLRVSGLALCAAFLAVSVPPPQSGAEQITIDAKAPGQPFPHVWEQTFGSGRAILSLRESWRNDLRQLKRATSVRFIRFHGIFDDEVGMVSKDAAGKITYNFSYIDQIYDGLLENGVRPFVELSFMPAALAQSQTPHAFWYKPLPNPPSDYAAWGTMITAFVRHLEQRYGAEEVQQWYFEVWNEPNIDFWTGQPKQATYFQLYDSAARAVKAADPALRVGGPASAQAAWIPALIEHCRQNQVPLDFVSTHVYGNDSAEDVFGTHEKIPRKSMVARSVKKVYEEVGRSPMPKLPIIWSEYNATYFNDPNVTDSAFMGPWLANNIRECDGMSEMMSYWSFSDVFEEQGVVKKPFYGGYGLIAAGGIPKAAYNAFQLLHELGTVRMSPELQNALVTKDASGHLRIAIWNYAEPGEAAADRTVELQWKGMAAAPKMMVRELSPDSGSALEAWEKMGRPDFPTREQQKQLRQASILPAARPLAGNTLRLKPRSLVLLEAAR